jgi:hypothetical protein
LRQAIGVLSRPQSLVITSWIAAVSLWIFVTCVLIPHQKNEELHSHAPRGNLSDLYPRWLGSRELLLRGRDPYSAEITREIQIGYYGRALDPSRPTDPKDQQAFAYPVYVALMLAPTVRMDFAVVRRLSIGFFVVITAGSVLLWLEAFAYPIPGWSKVAWIAYTLGSFPLIQGVKLQQLTILVAFIVAGAFWALVQRRFVLSGVLLAVATIKPQLVFLLTIWLCIWAMAIGASASACFGVSQSPVPCW